MAEIRAKLAPDTPVEVWFLLDGRGSRIDRYLRDLRICFTGAACPPGAGQWQFDHFSTHDHSFGPEDIAKMSAAFEAALGNLGLVDRSDPLTYEVAKLIIEFAKQGERDPERLCALTLQQLSK